MLPSFQTGFILANAAVVCAIMESISGLEPSSITAEPRCLKFVTVSSFCPFIWISVLMPLVLFVVSLVFHGQEVFVWSDCLLNLGTDFLVDNMVFVRDA